jgi:hypothetical protein
VRSAAPHSIPYAKRTGGAPVSAPHSIFNDDGDASSDFSIGDSPTNTRRAFSYSEDDEDFDVQSIDTDDSESSPPPLKDMEDDDDEKLTYPIVYNAEDFIAQYDSQFSCSAGQATEAFMREVETTPITTDTVGSYQPQLMASPYSPVRVASPAPILLAPLPSYSSGLPSFGTGPYGTNLRDLDLRDPSTPYTGAPTDTINLDADIGWRENTPTPAYNEWLQASAQALTPEERHAQAATTPPNPFSAPRLRLKCWSCHKWGHNKKVCPRRHPATIDNSDIHFTHLARFDGRRVYSIPRENYEENIVDEEYHKMRVYLEKNVRKWERQATLFKAKHNFWLDQRRQFFKRPYRAYKY